MKIGFSTVCVNHRDDKDFISPCNTSIQGFLNKSQLLAVYQYRCLFGTQVFGFRLTAPFAGKAAHYTIVSCLWKKVLKILQHIIQRTS